MTRAVKMSSIATRAVLCAGLSAGLSSVVLGCNTPPEPTPDPSATQKPAVTSKPAVTPARPLPARPPKRVIHAKPVAEVKPSPDDPLKGKWTLEDATKGLPAGDTIIASIETDMGTLECTMYADKAPITVANFVGLARGLRPWKTPDGKWETKPAYDGTVFHRIIKGFMIQGGDAKKNGTGEPGYVIPDEVWEGATHDRPGLLCMANRGPNTNGAQFFITDAGPVHLDGGYTIFGECGPVSLVHEIASVKMGRGDRPETAPQIKKVTVTRKAGAAPTGSSSAAPDASGSAAPAASGSSAPATSGSPSADPAKGATTSAPARATPPGPTAPAPTM